MADDKKIEAAANKHIETEYARYNSGEVYDEMICLRGKDSFKEGAKWAINELLKNLWHPASEEPRKDVSIMVETHNDKNMFYYAWNRWQDNFYPSWVDAVLCSRVSRWLYIDDLFLKEGGEK